MNSAEKLELVKGLRELADFLEANPELAFAQVSSMQFLFGYIPANESHEPSLRAWAKALGTFDKDAGNLYFRLRRKFGSLDVCVAADRDRVCRKVTKMQEVTTYECPESLLDESETKATTTA